MKIQARDLTMGEVANVFVGLKGGDCMIDWGDGHASVFQAHPLEVYPQYESHVYPSKCKKSGDVFDVVICSNEDNIVFLNTGCIDMAILDLDLSDCPELERLDLTRPVKSLDTQFNKSLKELSIYNAQGISMDLSHNQALEQLELRGYNNLRLDISKCDKLWFLDCGDSKIKDIVISNQSSLKEIIFRHRCPLDANLKSTAFLCATMDRNNGCITIVA